MFSDFLDIVQKGGIDEICRRDLMHWLYDLNSFFKFSADTFFLAASLVDRFLSKIKVRTNLLQIIGVSCFFIAAKLKEEEEDQPTLSELTSNCDNAFAECDVTRMEVTILEKLKWQIITPTPLQFLEGLCAYLTLISSGQVSCPRLKLGAHPDFVVPSPHQWKTMLDNLQAGIQRIDLSVECTNMLAETISCYESLSFSSGTLALTMVVNKLETCISGRDIGYLLGALASLVDVSAKEWGTCSTRTRCGYAT
jgi:hypothetical protein